MDLEFADPWFQTEFLPAPAGSSYDYVSQDGTTVINVKLTPGGIRDLYTGLLELALALAEQPQIQRAGLVLSLARISPNRLVEEWTRIQTVLKPKVAKRLALITIRHGQVWTVPDDPQLRRIGDALGPGVERRTGTLRPRQTRGATPTRKFFEVVKILIDRWLRRLGPIAIGELARQVGCTYPTATRAIQWLLLGRVLTRHSNRRVELTTFPQEAWLELLALSRSLRGSFRYVDVSGQPPTPDSLRRRLVRLTPPAVALGGVVAARHWQPQFDLNGTPRLDLTIHAPTNQPDLDFVRKLDPGLKLTQNDSDPAILVVHPLVRAEPLFAKDSGVLPWADPVEVLLDLHELRLDVQANQFLAHFRPEVKLP